jgi:hypothetical protein
MREIPAEKRRRAGNAVFTDVDGPLGVDLQLVSSPLNAWLNVET